MRAEQVVGGAFATGDPLRREFARKLGRGAGVVQFRRFVAQSHAKSVFLMWWVAFNSKMSAARPGHNWPGLSRSRVVSLESGWVNSQAWIPSAVRYW